MDIQKYYLLKELSENTLALLGILILLVFESLLETLLLKIPHINIIECMLIFSLQIMIIVMIDTTISVYKLVINLKNIQSDVYTNDTDLTETEKYLIEAYRVLEPNNKKALENMLRGIILQQQIDKNN